MRTVLLVALLVSALAGCSGGGDDKAPAPATKTATPTAATPHHTPTPATPAAVTPAVIDGDCETAAFPEPLGGPHAGATAVEAARLHAQRYLDGNADGYMAMVHPDFVDLLVEEPGPRPWPCRLQELRDTIADMEGVGQGLIATEVLDFEGVEVLNRTEYYDADNGTVFGIEVPFEPQPEDVLVMVSDVAATPPELDWYGLYRPSPNGWIMVAIPF